MSYYDSAHYSCSSRAYPWGPPDGDACWLIIISATLTQQQGATTLLLLLQLMDQQKKLMGQKKELMDQQKKLMGQKKELMDQQKKLMGQKNKLMGQKKELMDQMCRISRIEEDMLAVRNNEQQQRPICTCCCNKQVLHAAVVKETQTCNKQVQADTSAIQNGISSVTTSSNKLKHTRVCHKSQPKEEPVSKGAVGAMAGGRKRPKVKYEDEFDESEDDDKVKKKPAAKKEATKKPVSVKKEEEEEDEDEKPLSSLISIKRVAVKSEAPTAAPNRTTTKDVPFRDGGMEDDD